MIRPDAVTINVPFETENRIWAAARARVGLKKQNFRLDARHDDAEINRVSIRAEWAVSQYLQIPFDWDAAAMRGHRGTASFYWKDFAVDVKWTAYRGRPLYLFYGGGSEQPQPMTADLAVLVLPSRSPADVDLEGWTTRQTFSRLARVVELKDQPGKRLGLSYHLLQPMVDLPDYPPPPPAPPPPPPPNPQPSLF
jgi:hypothetical protein